MSHNIPGRVAGIDFGTVRIGIAVSDPDRRIASPYENYTRRGLKQDEERFRQLVEEEAIRLFVVGLPVHLDGRESEKSQEARQFGQWLAEATNVPVQFFDEPHSSSEERFLMLGRSSRLRLLLVAHTFRADDSVIRIISARGATGEEGRHYAGRKP